MCAALDVAVGVALEDVEGRGDGALEPRGGAVGEGVQDLRPDGRVRVVDERCNGV